MGYSSIAVPTIQSEPWWVRNQVRKLHLNPPPVCHRFAWAFLHVVREIALEPTMFQSVDCRHRCWIQHVTWEKSPGLVTGVHWTRLLGSNTDQKRQNMYEMSKICLRTGFGQLFERRETGGFPNRGVFHFFSEKVRVVLPTLLGLLLIGAASRPRKRKRTNRGNPRAIPRQIGKIPERTKKDKERSRSGSPRVWNPPVYRPLTFGSYSDIFLTFLMIPCFWAVQRFARYNPRPIRASEERFKRLRLWAPKS